MQSLAGDASGADLRARSAARWISTSRSWKRHYDNPTLRMADLEQLEQLASQAADRAELLADLTVDPPNGERHAAEDGDQTLVLSTLHSAKGLEWRVVYVLHATDGKIPYERSFGDPEQLEEERRMFYVALTRAADWLYVCHPRREASSYGNTAYGRSWGGVSESCQLTRFITRSIKSAFQSQQARTFQLPADAAVDEAPRGKRSPRKVGQTRK